MAQESETQKAIVQYLTFKHIFHWRQNSGAFKTEAGGFYRMGAKGAPDIFVVKEGTIYAIEVKSLTGRQNANQVSFQTDLERAGGKYFVVRTLDDVFKIGL